SATGAKNDPNATIPITLGIGGNYANPKPTLVTTEQKEQVKEVVTEKAKEEGTKAIQDAVKGTKDEDVVNKILGNPKSASDTTKTDTTKTTTSTPKEVEKARDAIKGLLKKKK